jgi:hypothetical protein
VCLGEEDRGSQAADRSHRVSRSCESLCASQRPGPSPEILDGNSMEVVSESQVHRGPTGLG